MASTYINVIKELREQAENTSLEVITLLEEGSDNYSHIRKLLERYEETLSAADLLEQAALHNKPATTTQQSTPDEEENESEEKPSSATDTAEQNATIFRPVTDAEDSNEIELQLAVIDANGKISEIEIAPDEGKSLIIGRIRDKPIPGVELAIDDPCISSKHCEIYWTQKDGWILIDYGTINGTELNGEAVAGEANMARFGQIRLGNSVIKFFPKTQQEKFMETMRLLIEH